MAARETRLRLNSLAVQAKRPTNACPAMPRDGVASAFAARIGWLAARPAGRPADARRLSGRTDAGHEPALLDRASQARASRVRASQERADQDRAQRDYSEPDRAGRTQAGQLQIGDVAEWSKASIHGIEHEGSNPSFTAEQTGGRTRDRAPRAPRLRTLNNDRVVQRDQHGPRDAHATGTTPLGTSVGGGRATRAASPSLPRRAAAGRWSGALPSGRRSEPPDA